MVVEVVVVWACAQQAGTRSGANGGGGGGVLAPAVTGGRVRTVDPKAAATAAMGRWGDGVRCPSRLLRAAQRQAEFCCKSASKMGVVVVQSMMIKVSTARAPAARSVAVGIALLDSLSLSLSWLSPSGAK